MVRPAVEWAGNEVPEVRQTPVDARVGTPVADHPTAVLARHPRGPLGVILRPATDRTGNIVQVGVAFAQIAVEVAMAGFSEGAPAEPREPASEPFKHAVLSVG